MGQWNSSISGNSRERGQGRINTFFRRRYVWLRNKFQPQLSTIEEKSGESNITGTESESSTGSRAKSINICDLQTNMHEATALRWAHESVEVHSIINLHTTTSSLISKRMISKTTVQREKSHSHSSAMSKTSLGSLRIRKAANEEVENKFPDEIFVSHMTEIFYYPFLVFWQLMISVVVIMTAELVTYNYIYTHNSSIIRGISQSQSMYNFIFGFNIVYLIDVIFSMIHKLWPEFELKMHYKVRTACWLLCDCLILLPLLLDSYLFADYQYIIHIIQLLAFYRIYFYFGSLKRIMAYSAQIVVLKMFIMVLFTILITSSVFYLYSCLPRIDEPHKLCGKGYFKEIIEKFSEDQRPTDELQLFIISQYFMFFLLPPQREGILYESFFFPRFVYLTVMLFIFYFLYCRILPDLCYQNFLANQKFHKYCLRRFLILQKLTALKYNDVVVQRIAWFYVYAWKKRMNLEYHVDCDDIPPQLVRNISFDIFFEALAHSDLFRSQDHEFLIVIANKMRSELHMEGDIIYGKNIIKNTMVYVLQGSVEVLSSEDDTTPLLVFGNGTLFGESCLLTSYFSNFILRCHSPACELHVLDKKDFWNISLTQKKYCRDIMNLIEDRYATGRLLRGFSDIINEKLNNTITSREQIVEPTGWVKITASRLLDLHFNTGERMSEWMRNLSQLDWWYKFAYHTTDHLMMLGFPQPGQTTSGDPMLLKVTFPLIFRPHSKLHDHWDRIVFILVIILAIILPYSYSFSCREVKIMKYVPLFYQFIFVTDIILQISTGIQSNEDVQKILQHRIQQFGFLIDLVTIVPIYMFEYLVPNDKANLRSSFQINQLLKLWKVGAFLENKWSARSEGHLYSLRFCKFMIYYSFLIYFTCSLFYSFSCFNNCKCLRKMFDSFRKEDADFPEVSNFELLICGMYKMTIMFLGDANPKVEVTVALEYYFAIAVRLISLFMQLYILSSLVQLRVIKHESRVKKRIISKNLLNIMQNAGMRQTVSDRAMRFCKKMLMFETDAHDFTKDLPPSFRVETKLTEYVENLIRHPLFEEALRDFITGCARKCTTVMMPEKEIVINLRHQPEEMFFVRRGFLMVGEGEGVGKIIKPGSGLGVVEVCLGIPYQRTIISITDCELIKLTRESFDCARHALIGPRSGYKNAVDAFKDIYAKERGSDTEPDMKMQAELYHMLNKLATPNLFKKEAMSSSETSGQFQGKRRKARRRRVIEYLWTLISYFQIRNTFHPESGFLWWWEISRWFIAVITAIYFPLDFQLRQCWMENGMFVLVLYAAAIVDMYIRMHIAYYDPNTNILITNRMKTASHYYKHGFIMDVFCALPFEIIPENKKLIKLLMRYNKVFSLYRYNLGLNMLAERYYSQRRLIYFFQYFVTLFVISNALAAALVVHSCEVGQNINTSNSFWSSCVICLNEGWPHFVREIGIEHNHMSAVKTYSVSLYWAVSMITCNSLPHIYARTVSERTIALFAVLLGAYLSFHYLTTIIAHGMDEGTSMKKYQTQVRKLLKYLKIKKMPKYLVRLVKQHIHVNWVTTRNSKIEKVIKDFPRPLQNDIMLHMYFNALSVNTLLSYANYTFFEKLFDHVTTQVYVKECSILLSGDIISDVYFLVEGTVEIYDENDTLIKEVGPGSVFGAVAKCKYHFSMYSVLAQSTVQVLIISSIEFHNKVLPTEPYLMKVFSTSRAERLLIMVEKRVSIAPIDFGLDIMELKINKNRLTVGALKQVYSKLNIASRMPAVSFIRNVCSAIYTTIISYWSEEMVLFSCLSVMLVLYTTTTCDSRIGLFVIFYLLDILKSFNILALLIKMRRKNMCSSVSGVLTGVGGVMFNVIMVLPYEVLFFLIFGISHLTFMLRANRLISLQFLYKYWKFKCMTALNHSLSTRISSKCAFCLLIFLSLIIIILASLLYFLHNWERNYSYSNLPNATKSIVYIRMISFIIGIRVHVLDADTTDFPISVVTFVITIMFVLVRPLFITIFLTFFYVCVFDKRFIYPDYWHRYKKLMAFLKDAKTTSSLFMLAKRHMELFWQQNRGSHQPELFKKLPYHLRAAINNYAYGKYLFFSELFSGCSLNFLRQVGACLKPMTLYAGDMIVTTGTRDGSMYFVMSGVVLVNDLQSDTTTDVLYQWDSFGWRQGLGSARYDSDYVAYSQIKILRLKFTDWEHLISFYEDDYQKVHWNLFTIESREGAVPPEV